MTVMNQSLAELLICYAIVLFDYICLLFLYYMLFSVFHPGTSILVSQCEHVNYFIQQKKQDYFIHVLARHVQYRADRSSWCEKC